jgi:hypothetical protein
MANNKQSWGTRGKRTSVIALGLVAILAGVAVAYFLTLQKFENNYAKGGELTVNAEGLPLDFTGDPSCHTPTGTAANPDTCETLFPTNGGASDPAAKTENFAISNENPVETSYIMYATCALCAVNADEQNQFDHLMVQIKGVSTATGLACVPSCPPVTTYYTGRLADLTADNFANLGKVASGATTTYAVTLWLANDQDNVQPQKVLSNWEFFVGATLPAPS